MRMKDKVVIVTGGGRGIGEGICRKLAEEGAKVVVADLVYDNAAAIAQQIVNRGGTALALKADITKKDDVAQMAGKVIEEFGRIDALVNNAGWDKVEPFLESIEETWNKVLAINLKGTLYTCKEILPIMIQQGYGKSCEHRL